MELVPHPETAPATVDRTYALMRKIGQSPVKLTKEVDGFALNRLQYAVISEAWRLVEVCVPPSVRAAEQRGREPLGTPCGWESQTLALLQRPGQAIPLCVSEIPLYGRSLGIRMW